MNENQIIISLDKSGNTITSEEFTQLITQQKQDNKNISFLIGGADGISASCLKKSNIIISFGKMTWPHLLARLLLAEQLYRASSIISNHPYNRN